MTEFTAMIERLRGAAVVVVGDVMVDEYVRGDIQRISPEAPVPVLEIRSTERRLGGAANAAANIAALGGKATLVGIVGADAAAEDLRTDLARAGVTAQMRADATRPTTKKTRLVAQQQQIARIDQEVRTPIAGAVAAELIAAIQRAVEGAAVVVLSDYAKGVVTADVARATMTAARARGVPVIVDPKQRDFSLYRGAAVITPNLAELERATGAPAHGDAEIAAAVARLPEALHDTQVLVTRGADGMTLFRGGARAHHVPAMAREVFDVTGAGDTVVATLALALAAGIDMPNAMELASLAAGVAVSKRGTATVTPADLVAAIAERRAP